MSIRTRLTLWYALTTSVSLLLMGWLTWREFAPEPTILTPAEDKDHERDRRETLSILFWCGCPSAFLALSGGWWLTRRALLPVETVIGAVEQINDRNLQELLPVTKRHDELTRLTEVFNAMMTRLHGAFARIQDFTLHASHELKTPLTILCGETETELQSHALTDIQRRSAESRLEELHRLSRIVDGLSLLTKADAGLVQLSFERIPLHELVREALADGQILALPHGIKVTLETCQEVFIQGDRHRLRQLFLNLVDNAVKYNFPNGSIQMSLREGEGGVAEYRISNGGAGIPEEMLTRVFDRFFRGNSARGHNVEGCGLGLSIAQWIVTVHKGTIHIASVPGKVTTLTVRMPLDQKPNA
ncbi:MAG: sensor histidine kinase [Verrucomicrobiota bacterium]